MVVMIHVSAQNWSHVNVYSKEWNVFNFFDSAVRSAVPLFFMISGQLFLSKKDFSVSGMLQKNILRLLTIYLAWSIFYAVDEVGISKLFSKEFIKAVIYEKYHLWFLPKMIMVYLLAPILYSVAHYENGKYLLYTSILFFIFSIAVTIFNLIPGLYSGVNYMIQKFYYELSGYSGYFLLGYYLSKQDFRKLRIRYLGLLLLLVIGASVLVGKAHAFHIGEQSALLYGYMTFPVYLEAVINFIIFSKLQPTIQNRVSKKGIKNVLAVSGFSLGIYLVHPFVMEQLVLCFHLDTLSFHALLSVPLLSVLVFAISFIVSYVLSKIPVVNKWLI